MKKKQGKLKWKQRLKTKGGQKRAKIKPINNMEDTGKEKIKGEKNEMGGKGRYRKNEVKIKQK